MIRQRLTKCTLEAIQENKRPRDEDVVVSPKGMSPEVWQLANDIAMMIRSWAERTTTRDDILMMASAVIVMQENENVFYRLFTNGAIDYIKLFERLTNNLGNLGFGKILEETAKELSKREEEMK
jgi:hypothetical protein